MSTTFSQTLKPLEPCENAGFKASTFSCDISSSGHISQLYFTWIWVTSKAVACTSLCPVFWAAAHVTPWSCSCVRIFCCWTFVCPSCARCRTCLPQALMLGQEGSVLCVHSCKLGSPKGISPFGSTPRAVGGRSKVWLSITSGPPSVFVFFQWDLLGFYVLFSWDSGARRLLVLEMM